MPRRARRRTTLEEGPPGAVAVAVTPSDVTSNYYHIADLMTGLGEGVSLGPRENAIHITFNSLINLNKVFIQGDLHDVIITAHHPHQRNQQTTIIACGIEGVAFDADILRTPIIGVLSLEITANEKSTIKQLIVYKACAHLGNPPSSNAPSCPDYVEDEETNEEVIEGPPATEREEDYRVHPDEINARESNCHAVRPAVFLSLNNTPIAYVLDEGSPINFAAGDRDEGKIRLVFRIPLLIDRIAIDGEIHHGIDIEVVSINSNERNTVVYSNLNSGEQEGADTGDFQPIFATGVVIMLHGAAVINRVFIKKVIEVKPYSPPETEPRTGHGAILQSDPDGSLHHVPQVVSDDPRGLSPNDAELRHQLDMIRQHNEVLERSVRNTFDAPAQSLRRAGNGIQSAVDRLNRTIQSAAENLFVDPISQNVYRRDDYVLDVVEFGARIANGVRERVGNHYVVPTGIEFMFGPTHKPLIRLDPSIGELPDSWKRNVKIIIEVFDAMHMVMKGRIYECSYEDYLNPQSEADNHLRGNVRAQGGDIISVSLLSHISVLPDGRDFEVEGKVRLECYRLYNVR